MNPKNGQLNLGSSWSLAFGLLLQAVLGIGCNGGSSTPPPVISVSLSASAQTMLESTTASFTATVTNDSANKGVTWTVSCTASACGSVSPTTTKTGIPTTYRAPASPSNDLKVTLTATSVTDTTKAQSATITVPAITVAVSPTSGTVLTNATAQFMATVGNDPTNGGVNWTLAQNGTACSPGCGSVAPGNTASGQAMTYTPPATVPNPATVTLTATSVVDNTKSAGATVTLAAPPVSVTVAPKLATAVVNQTAKFTATVKNDPAQKGVAWTLSQGGAGCSPSCGTVAPTNTPSGTATVYTAPATLPTNASVTLTATAGADNTATDTATVTIVAAVAPNAVPFLNQTLVPETAQTGGSAFTLTVNGTGFVPGSKVNWNGSARTTTFVSSSQLKADIAATDIAKPGTATITVSSPSPGGGMSNQVFFETTLPSITVAFQTTDVTAGAAPSAVAVADFNGDGKLDLAVTNFNDNTVSVLLGNGDSTFQVPTTYAAGVNPFSVAVGDFNGDAKLDLAVANVGENTVFVYLGNGDGTFQTGVKYVAGNAARTVVLGDFNADGKLDMAVANQTCGTPGCGPGVVSVLLGNGDGTFQPHSDYAAAGGPTWMTVGDFNQDSILDLAVTGGDSGAGTQISILIGNGDGTFQAPVNYTVPTNPAGIATADLNNDGKLDLAIANNSGTLSILLGNGDGTFQTAVNYGAGGSPIGSIAVADLNGDGIADLAIANGGTNISIYLGNGDGTFQQQMLVNALSNSFGVAAGDFNQDGRLDLAIPDQGGTTVPIAMQMPTLSVSPTSVTFDPTLVGITSAAQMVTLTNTGGLTVSINSIAITGTNAGDFAQTNNCGATLPGGANCTINVTFTPSQTGPRTASLAFPNAAGGSAQTLDLTGIGLVMGTNATIMPDSLTFNSQLVGTTSTAQAVTLTNYGTSALNITSISASAKFTQTNNCGSALLSGASCNINVSFAPTAAGTVNGTVTIADNAPASPQMIALTGTGTFVELNPPVLSFGLVRVNTSVMKSTTLTNTASTTLAITSITLSGSGASAFTESNTCGTSVAAGSSCTITVTFHPVEKGLRSAMVTITDSDPGSPQTVAVTGTGKQFPQTATWHSTLSSQQAASAPTPTGAEAVGTRVMDLVDQTRDDPNLPKGTKREVLVRSWYPTPSSNECKLADYAEPAVWRRFAQLGGVSLPQVKTNSCWEAPVSAGLHPVVIFTPGYTATFTDYTFLMEDLASRGYVVVSVDHTYEATAMKFPDGRFVESAVGSYIQADKVKSDEQTLSAAVLARLGDLEFVANELVMLNAEGDSPFAGRLDPSRVALAGHSLGGLTALYAMQFDSRFRAGVLLDPYLLDKFTMPVRNPVLLLVTGRTEWSDAETSLWNHLQGRRFAMNLVGTEHTTPTDAVWLVKTESQVGPMGEEKTIEAMRKYIAAFLDANIRDEAPSPLLAGPSAEYPQVKITRQNEGLRSQPE